MPDLYSRSNVYFLIGVTFWLLINTFYPLVTKTLIYVCLCSDVPSPPEGPLTPFNITKNACQLQWRPPKDDGGSDITHYIVEKMDAENLRWVPVTEVSGTQAR